MLYPSDSPRPLTIANTLNPRETVAGEGHASAVALFTDRPDLDADAFARNFASSATIGVGRAHDQLTGGDAPPFGVAKITDAGDRYLADIEFLPTTRGREEYATAKALDAAGVTQAVSIGFLTEQVGPVPDALRALGVRRYITKGRFLELSLVGVGAIPGAQLTSVKCDACAGKQTQRVPTDAELRVAIARGKAAIERTTPHVFTQGECARLDADVRRMRGRLAATFPPDAEQCALAAKWADAMVRYTETPRVGIRWGTSSDNAGSYAEGTGVIRLNPMIRGRLLVAAVVHECLHAARDFRGLSQDERIVALEEREALRYFGVAA